MSLYSLSSILLSEFTLELRRSDLATSNISLPTISDIDMLQSTTHQPVPVQMGDAGDRENIPKALHPVDVAQNSDSSQPVIESVHVSV